MGFNPSKEMDMKNIEGFLKFHVVVHQPWTFIEYWSYAIGDFVFLFFEEWLIDRYPFTFETKFTELWSA